MIRWLTGRIARKREPSAVQPADIRRLEVRIQELERQLKEALRDRKQIPSTTSSSQQTSPPNIHIHTLHVHHAALDNLTFRLDALDIKELSGSLNLGNNFGANMKKPSPVKPDTVSNPPTTYRKPSETAAKREEPSIRPESSCSNEKVPITSTASGFKISPVQKDKR